MPTAKGIVAVLQDTAAGWAASNIPIDRGVVRFDIEYTYAKGHQQSAGSIFGPTTTIYVEMTITAGGADRYKHFIAEINVAQAFGGVDLEPDSMILTRMFRDAAHPNDTFPDAIFIFQTDMHYQRNQLSTKNKAPNFYT